MSKPNVILRVQAEVGSPFAAPASMFPRGVFNVMGHIEAHIEVSPDHPYRNYEIVTVSCGSAVPASAMYLGNVQDTFGRSIRHFYAVEVAG